MSEVAKGGCLCGEYQYEFPRNAVISAFHCHCKDCQKSSGGGKSTIVLVPTELLSTQGTLKSYTQTGTEGAHVSRGFCSHCGSQVISQVEELPGVRMVKAGTLEDGSWLEVNTSCWSASAAPWAPVDEAGAVFEYNPKM